MDNDVWCMFFHSLSNMCSVVVLAYAVWQLGNDNNIWIMSRQNCWGSALLDLHVFCLIMFTHTGHNRLHSRGLFICLLMFKQSDTDGYINKQANRKKTTSALNAIMRLMKQDAFLWHITWSPSVSTSLIFVLYGVSSQNDGNHFRSVTNKQTKIYEYLIHFDISSKCWNLKRYNNIYYFGDGVAATRWQEQSLQVWWQNCRPKCRRKRRRYNVNPLPRDVVYNLLEMFI